MIVLLVIIYIAFISLGLPDSLLGSAWPSMYRGLGVALSSAGAISMMIAGGTIVSSLFSDRLIRRFGTGVVTLVSVAMTAAALLGISCAGSFWLICLYAIPLGLGAGSVDAALNNFVALHYKATHMNWLHCFWGVGASLGPIILSGFLLRTGQWSSGYRAISVIQFALVAILAATLPLWRKANGGSGEDGENDSEAIGIGRLLRLPKAKPTLVAFFCYCALEMTVGLWGSSYMALVRGIPQDVAAGWISLYYIGITLGRMASGFLSIKLTQKRMIQLGQTTILLGIACILAPFPNRFVMVGLFLIGLGCAPIFPSLLHETPNTFGKKYSQSIMGIQMASAYIGTTFMPPLFGLLAARVGHGLFPYYLAILSALMIGMVRMVYKGGTQPHACEN